VKHLKIKVSLGPTKLHIRPKRCKNQPRHQDFCPGSAHENQDTCDHFCTIQVLRIFKNVVVCHLMIKDKKRQETFHIMKHGDQEQIVK